MVELLKFFARTDAIWCLFWNESLEFSIVCNDIFSPGSDTELITEDDIPELQRALDDSDEFYFPYLFCARKRLQPPMERFYNDMDEDLQKLFKRVGVEHTCQE